MSLPVAWRNNPTIATPALVNSRWRQLPHWRRRRAGRPPRPDTTSRLLRRPPSSSTRHRLETPRPLDSRTSRAPAWGPRRSPGHHRRNRTDRHTSDGNPFSRSTRASFSVGTPRWRGRWTPCAECVRATRPCSWCWARPEPASRVFCVRESCPGCKDRQASISSSTLSAPSSRRSPAPAGWHRRSAPRGNASAWHSRR